MMSKLIYYPFVLIFLSGIYFLMQAFDTPDEHIYYREIAAEDQSGKVLVTDTLRPKTKTDLYVQPAPSREIFWRIATPRADTLHYIEYTQPFAFDEAGMYYIEAYHKLRKVGASTVHIPAGKYIKFEISATRLTEGESLTAKDISTAKAEKKRWRITTSTNDVTLNDLEDIAEFNWTASKEGEYTLHLEYLDEDGQVALYESKNIEVLSKPAPVRTTTPAQVPVPKREASAAEILAAKEKQAEKDRLKKDKQEADARQKMEADEKARREKEEKDRASMPSWYDHTIGAQFTTGPITPLDRREVTFKSGMTAFTLTAKEDIALTSLHYWGNFNTGNVSINMECLTCSGAQKKLRAYTFLSGQGTNLANERNIATGKGFVKGHTYKVTVTMEKETELGFVKLNKLQWSDPYMELKFETSETPVYGLTFQKR